MTQEKLSTRIIRKVYYGSIKERCYVCGIRDGGNLCCTCQTFLALNHSNCRKCARPMPSSVALCGQCQTHPPSFQQIIAPLSYSGLTRGLITRAKFSQKGHLLRPLASLLATTLLTQLDQTKYWHWCVIPSGKASLIERGFCQTRFIRSQLKQIMQSHLTHPFSQFDVVRTKERPAQHTLSKKDRHRINASAFSIPLPAPKYVILIDDVITTGSTVEACARALRNAGSLEVVVVALARTPSQSGEQN